jgi:hypothetical protein
MYNTQMSAELVEHVLEIAISRYGVLTLDGSVDSLFDN